MRISFWMIFLLALPLTAQAEGVIAGAGQQMQTHQPLRQMFDLAWARQAASQALPEQRQAVAARQAAAAAWTPEPVAIEVGGRSDRFNQNRGAAEVELGVAIPLWLPGERAGRQALADTEAGLLEEAQTAWRWQLAGELRSAWWDWHLAREDALLAASELTSAQHLSDDVVRRVAAGVLSRADQHQAAAALASARAAKAEADFRLVKAAAALHTLTGVAPEFSANLASGQSDLLPAQPAMELPPVIQGEGWLDAHPRLRVLRFQSEQARHSQSLARTRSRANPEFTLATRRERGARGEAGEQSWAMGLRIPLSSGAQHAAAIADANAALISAEITYLREREQVLFAAQLGQQQWQAAAQRRLASEEAARLARETLGFFVKSFQLGETDLPTRLRVEQAAFAAERAAQRARIEQAAALSAYRQALGLLPE